MSRASIAGIVLTAGLAVACSRADQPGGSGESGGGQAGPRLPPIENYRNGLSDDERRRFYHLSEGGEVIPLSVLQALERARTPQDPPGDGLVSFTSNLQRYGFISDDVSDQNPFELPVGMTVARSRLTDRLIVGFNCTTCHVGEIWKGGRRVRIDGGPNMIRLNDLFADVKKELTATVKETGRRERFLLEVARRRRDNDAKMPSTRSASQRIDSLDEDLGLAKATIGYLEAMPTLKQMATVENGYGRVDAFGVARNLLFGNEPKNLRPHNAPVSFPHIWGIETTAWLQWGANMNSVMERNIGQSLGVGAVYDVTTFATTSRLDNLNALERLMYKITPPAWPTEVLGPIDHARADRGRPIYERACSNCHERPFEITPSGLVVHQLFSSKQAGVSSLVAENFDQTVLVNGKEIRFADAAFPVLEGLKKQYYAANNISEATQAEWENRARRPPPEWAPRVRSTLADSEKFPDSRGGRVHPAKPLAGIWATAPYLNNGSVANMWDLLTAPEMRPKTFALGSREYDTEKLGYRTTPDAAAPAPAWELKTSEAGNSNAGHVYGTNLSDDDKRDLIEYLKVLHPGDLKKEPVRGSR
jgi:hypothetical protein